MNNLSVLQELIARWKAKSPKLFFYIQVVAAICFFVSGLPQLLIDLGITLPESLQVLASKIIGVASTVAFIISKLTVATPSETTKVLKGNDTEQN